MTTVELHLIMDFQAVMFSIYIPTTAINHTQKMHVRQVKKKKLFSGASHEHHGSFCIDTYLTVILTL